MKAEMPLWWSVLIVLVGCLAAALIILYAGMVA